MRADLRTLAAQRGVDLDALLAVLDSFYRGIDARNAQNTAALSLPCRSGCDACCKDSVFLTPLEFLGVWDLLQKSVSDPVLTEVVGVGLALYKQHRETITALDQPTLDGEKEHVRLALRLRYPCPLLDSAGTCRVYARRELYSRLFGNSFNDDSGIYGCAQIGALLSGKVVTLLSVRRTAQSLEDLPLTAWRQVYPYYIHALYSGEGRSGDLFADKA
jgi:Fe-S-cluster containining protein